MTYIVLSHLQPNSWATALTFFLQIFLVSSFHFSISFNSILENFFTTPAIFHYSVTIMILFIFQENVSLFQVEMYNTFQNIFHPFPTFLDYDNLYLAHKPVKTDHRTIYKY